MPIAPLGIGSYKRNDGLVPEVVLRNMYLEEDKSGISPDKTLRIQRPGLSLVYDYGSPIRGVHYRTSPAEYLIVSGQTLYSGPTPKGSIGGNDNAAMTSTQFATAIVSGRAAYLYTTGLAQVTIPADAPSGGLVQDVDQLNNYILLLQPNGRFYWIEPGENTINALNFATAERSPDPVISVRSVGDQFWLLGTNSTEVWYPTGNADAPFLRTQGKVFDRGIWEGTDVQIEDLIVLIDQDGVCYAIAGGGPQRISNNSVEERIRNAIREQKTFFG